VGVNTRQQASNVPARLTIKGFPQKQNMHKEARRSKIGIFLLGFEEGKTVVMGRCACKKARATFGIKGAKPTRCASCQTKGMIDVRSKRCLCKKAQASFGLEGEKPTCCASCRTEGMVNVRSKSCLCKKAQPTYGLENETPTRCASCRTEGMINVIGKRCLCKKAQPTYGLENEKPTRCASCRTAGMVDVISKRCRCEKAQPTYGLEGEKPTCCASCRTEGMIDVKIRRCLCKRTKPFFGLEAKKPTRCASCKTEGMIDVISKRCLKNGCGTRVGKRYKGYCLRCFVFTFPGEKVSCNYRVKEQHFTDYIKASGVLPEGADITFDKRLQGGCSGRKPDIFADLYTHTVHCENDEDQHRNYTCENKRMMELFQDAGSRPQVQLRFNPDGYTSVDGRKHPGCFKYNKLGVPVIRDQAMWEERINAYLERLQYHLTHVLGREVTVEHMFYDGFEWKGTVESDRVGQKRKRADR
jgi:hypothetical protein